MQMASARSIIDVQENGQASNAFYNFTDNQHILTQQSGWISWGLISILDSSSALLNQSLLGFWGSTFVSSKTQVFFFRIHTFL